MSADPMPSDHSARPVPRNGFPGVFLAFTAFAALSAVGLPYGLYVTFQDEARNGTVNAALGDPAFVAMAAKAGYRVERTRGEGGWIARYRVLARCFRASEAGPLPCGPFPESPDHPGIPVEVRG